MAKEINKKPRAARAQPENRRGRRAAKQQRTGPDLSGLIHQLDELRRHMLEMEDAYAHQMESIHCERLRSARNLLHYVSLRHHDIRALQEELVSLGLSSMGRCEAHVNELVARGRPDMGIILKIENRQAFEHLPSLLLAAMRNRTAGVMIARGDLAVECGYQRLAEIQEELLWMCEAAHMPAIWATQVLERLAKEGLPSRAEITDAAMSVRAECVMLNKGPHVVDAVRALDDILLRMQDHQVKKRPMLRRLRLADNLMAASDD